MFALSSRGSYESRDYMFGIIGNYYCLLFDGSDMKQGFEIAGYILCGTRMHYGNIYKVVNVPLHF